VESLGKKGYNADGTRLPDTKNESDLFGTANLIAMPAIVKMRFNEIVEQTDLAVEEMMRRQENGSRNTRRQATRAVVVKKVGEQKPAFTISRKRM